MKTWTDVVLATRPSNQPDNAHGIADRGLDLGQVAVDLREPEDVEAEQQALVLGKVPVQRQGELVDLAP